MQTMEHTSMHLTTATGVHDFLMVGGDGSAEELARWADRLVELSQCYDQDDYTASRKTNEHQHARQGNNWRHSRTWAVVSFLVMRIPCKITRMCTNKNINNSYKCVVKPRVWSPRSFQGSTPPQTRRRHPKGGGKAAPTARGGRAPPKTKQVPPSPPHSAWWSFGPLPSLLLWVVVLCNSTNSPYPKQHIAPSEKRRSEKGTPPTRERETHHKTKRRWKAARLPVMRRKTGPPTSVEVGRNTTQQEEEKAAPPSLWTGAAVTLILPLCGAVSSHILLWCVRAPFST